MPPAIGLLQAWVKQSSLTETKVMSPSGGMAFFLYAFVHDSPRAGLIVQTSPCAPPGADHLSSSTEPSQRRRSRARRVPLLATCFALVAIAVISAIVVAASGPPRLPTREAERESLDDMAYRFAWREDADPALWRVGSAPNPATVMETAESETAIVVSLFEPTANAVRVFDVDKKTGEQRVYEAKAYISYGLIADRRDPEIFYMITGQLAHVWRLDRRRRVLELWHTFENEMHTFSVAQDYDGSLLVGTYPTAALYRVRCDEVEPRCERIPLERELIGPRRYLHYIVVGDTETCLSFGSPSLVLARDREGKTRVVSEADEPFAAQGTVQALAGKPAQQASYSIESKGFVARLRFGSKDVDLSLAPISDGSHLSSFVAVRGDLAIGNTYWNHWFFTLDLKRRILRMHGPTGECGEFFAAGPFESGVLIPHYQGTLLYYDPAKPFEYRAGAKTNPQIIAQVSHAHFGTTSVSDGRGTAFYATAPNYHRKFGMLMRYRRDSGAEVLPVEDTTIHRLAFVGRRLFGGTSNSRGLGTSSAEAQVARVVEIDPEQGHIIKSSRLLPETRAAVVGLCHSQSRLMAVTEYGRVHALELDGSTWTQRSTDWNRPVAVALAYRQHGVLLLSTHRLGLLRNSDAGPRVEDLFGLREPQLYMAVASSGDLYLANRVSLFVIPARVLEQRIRDQLR